MTYRLMAALLLCCSAQAAELPWDLTYRSVLTKYPVADREMGEWIAAAPKRQVVLQLAEYKGAPIEASLLTEQAAPVEGGLVSIWVMSTRDSAQACTLATRRETQACRPIDRARAEEIIRAVANLPAPPQPDERGGKVRYDNYVSLLSVYVDGKAVQRPVLSSEAIDCNAEAAGRSGATPMSKALARIYLSDAELVERDLAEQKDRAANPQRYYPSRMCPKQS
jgi:hypothetical protein